MARTLAVLLPLLAAGCATLALTLEKPEVSVSGVLLLPGGTLFDQRLRVDLQVANPNNRDIAIDGLSFRFALNGVEVARGLSNQATVLPRLGEAALSVDVRASLVDLLRQAPRLLEARGQLAYRVRGEVVTRDYGRLPFDRSGEVRLDALLDKKAGEPAAPRGQF